MAGPPTGDRGARRLPGAAGRIARRLGLSLVLLVFGYGAAGMAGGAIPANAGWREPERGVEIFVEASAIHTALVLPKVAAGIDWRDLARPQDLADPRFANYDHVVLGWGEQNFFLKTATWADVRPQVILAAALGSDLTLMHVEHVPRPSPAPDMRRVVLRPEEYRRLAAFIRASVVPDGRRWPGYGGYDAFIQARGHYDAVTTCNSWAGAALRRAGVRVGAWTPFPVTVIGWFPEGG